MRCVRFLSAALMLATIQGLSFGGGAKPSTVRSATASAPPQGSVPAKGNQAKVRHRVFRPYTITTHEEIFVVRIIRPSYVITGHEEVFIFFAFLR